MNELLHSLDWVLPLRSDALTPLMRFFTLLGYEKFILFFLPLGYWAWHRTVFFRLLVLVAITALLNAWLKDYWQDPRPDIALRMDHEVGESFGLPSGHAQISVVIWFWLALEVMHRHKTGALIEASVRLGALASGNADDSSMKSLQAYAQAIGLAFQVQDDILDVESDTVTLGKTQGKDQASDKPTYPALLGLDDAKAYALELRDMALHTLRPFSEAAEPLRDLARYIVERRS